MSDGCKHCYAETLSARNPKVLGVWGPKGQRVIAAESYWREPLKWNQEAQAVGERRRVFCASLADVFEGQETMPAESWEPVQAARLRLFRLIRDTPHLDWLLLTKRPENVLQLLQEAQSTSESVGLYQDMHGEALTAWLTLWLGGTPPGNVWIGTSVENTKVAQRITDLVQVPARIRFLSCEPLIEDISVLSYLTGGSIHWVIVGGESGPHARPMHPDWARRLRDECVAAKVPFHFKQYGEWLPIATPRLNMEIGSTLLIHPDGSTKSADWADVMATKGDIWAIQRVGKKAAGRVLDGRTWDELPQGMGGQP